MINKIMAKSVNNGNVTLLKHSNDVYDVMLTSIDKYMSTESILDNKSYSSSYMGIETLKQAALLHDIGKATKSFQNYICNGISDIEADGDFYRHNEIGYAFLKAYTNESTYVCNLVYWHHDLLTKDNYRISLRKILDELTSDDIIMMSSIYKSLTGKDALLNPKVKVTDKTPEYYSSDIDEDSSFMFALNLLLCSDRCASDTTKKLTVESMINKVSNIRKHATPYDSERFQKQIEIASNQKNMYVVNAPAGFGKTMIGALWSTKSDRKTIWVCPRNSVTKTVYNSIKKEIDILELDYSISCVIANEVTESTNNSNIPFENDITIINIDSFISPSFDTSNIMSYSNIFNADVIFDEYHELFSKCALTYLFINILRARILNSNSRTLLLSASPIYFEELLNINDNIEYLPGKYQHYEPAHNNLYDVHLTEDYEVNKIENNALYIFNTISEVHTVAKKLKHHKVFHSYFNDADRERITNDITSTYGDKNNTSIKEGYISAPIIQASFDVSFSILFETVLSHLTTIQRIGRCDRWGLLLSRLIHINISRNRSNSAITEILYNDELYELWVEALKNRIGTFCKMTLSDFYELYNIFCRDNEKELNKLLSDWIYDSTETIKDIFPKRKKEYTKSNIIMTGGNVLRKSTSGSDIWVTCKDINGEFIEPIQINVRDIDYKFNGNKSDYKILKDLHPLMLESTKKGIYDYKYVYKRGKMTKDNIQSDKIKDGAKFSDKPYPVVNHSYSSTWGFFKI